jgi:integrase
MSRQTKKLTARGVASLKTIGRHSDGGNLYFTITRTAAGLSRRWTFMYSRDGNQHELGLGSAAMVSLSDARKKAAQLRSLLDAGIDPMSAKTAASEAAKAVAARKSFGMCAVALFESKSKVWRSAKYRRQWLRSLKDHAAVIWDRPVADIDTESVLAVISPLWQRVPATAARLREKIEATLDFAKAHKLRSGENPAAWRNHLALILPKRAKLSKRHFAALPYASVPAFVASLRESESIFAAVLEFAILTAARSGEVLGARWSEIDLDAKVWTIPGERMKSGQEHRVPLSDRVIEIIEKQAATRSSEYLFPGMKVGKPLASSSLRKLHPEGATLHGLRSSFRDWVSEETSFPREIAEQALAHATGGAVELAYRRGDALEKRRALMQAWAQFCEPGAAGNVVVPIRAAK